MKKLKPALKVLAMTLVMLMLFSTGNIAFAGDYIHVIFANSFEHGEYAPSSVLEVTSEELTPEKFEPPVIIPESGYALSYWLDTDTNDHVDPSDFFNYITSYESFNAHLEGIACTYHFTPVLVPTAAPVEYTVTFGAENGSVMGSTTAQVVSGSTIYESAMPQIDNDMNCVFKLWWNDTDKVPFTPGVSTITKNTTLIAVYYDFGEVTVCFITDGNCTLHNGDQGYYSFEHKHSKIGDRYPDYLNNVLPLNVNTGYAFDHWENAETGDPFDIENGVLDDDIILKAVCVSTSTTATVSFKTGTVTDETPIIVEIGDVIGESEMPAPILPDGQELDYWMDDISGNYFYSEITPVDSDMYLEPVFKPAEYDVAVNVIYDGYRTVSTTIAEPFDFDLESYISDAANISALVGTPEPGFTFSKAESSKNKVTDNSAEINIYYAAISNYEPEYTDVEVQYIYPDSSEDNETKTITGNDEEEFEDDILPPPQPGKVDDTFVPEITYEWGIDAETGDAELLKVIVEYKKAAKLRIGYNFPAGTDRGLDENVELDIAIGEEYEITSPVIEGYKANPEVITGTMTADGAEITVEYEKDPYQWATLFFIAGDGGRFLSGKTVEREYLIGTNYSAGRRPLVLPDEGFMEGGWDNEPADEITEDAAVVCNFVPSDGSETLIARIYNSLLRMIIKAIAAMAESFAGSGIC